MAGLSAVGAGGAVAGGAGAGGAAGGPASQGHGAGFYANIDGPTKVVVALSLPPASPGRGTRASPYQFKLVAKGGKAPYSWSAYGLPNGVRVNPATGVLSGSPTEAGTFTVTVVVSDSTKPQQGLGAARYQLTIAP